MVFKENKLFDKRGSTIVEAAIVMPIVVLAVISVIIMLTFFVHGIFAQVALHEALIDERESEKFEITYDFKNAKRISEAKYCYEQNGGLLLDNRLKGKTYGRKYEISEKETIRYVDFFKGQIEE